MADTGSISGQVVNIRNMQPVGGATVKCTGPTSETTTTDRSGNFKLNNLAPSDNYALDISASGYETGDYRDIVVLAGIDTNLYKLPLMPT